MIPHSFDLAAIGSGLPVAAAREDLELAIRGGAVIVTAPPGTGKTTYVPALVANVLADIAAARDGAPNSGATPALTLLSQPRRVAVRAAARRIAQLDGSELGGPVGFTVRGERNVGRGTVIEALTPGVLLRRLLTDPGLDGVGAVILDEIHERSVDGDLLLGMLAELRELRPELIVVAMSATLDAAATAELLAATIVAVPSALHPLTVDYAPSAAARLDERGVTRAFLSHVAATALAEQASAGSDALVFLPGAREVDAVVRLIRDVAPASVGETLEVLPLHGRLSAREQDRAVSGRGPTDPPRIVVSTSLAESSLTVPGVRLVVDAGLSREVRRDRGRDMTGLVTVSASRASADQRAGRAAREGAGRAVRVFSQTDFARMPAAVTPEILSADLTDAALLLAAWGTPGGTEMRLPTTPPAAAMAQAVATLFTLDLVDGGGSLTPLGASVARMPVGVREARALLSGTQAGADVTRVAEVIAALSDDFRANDADLAGVLRELRTGRAPGARRWKRETQRLARLASEAREQQAAGKTREDSAGSRQSPGLSDAGIIALTRPEWIAKRAAAHSRSYLLASGTRAALPEGSPLLGTDWIAVREVQRAEGRAADGTGAVIRLAGALTKEEAFHVGSPLRKSTRSARIVEARVQVREEDHFGEILLSSRPTAALPGDAGPAFAAHVRENGIAALDWSEAAVSLRSRLALLHHELGEPWPAVDDDALLASIDDWLGPDLERLRPNASLRDISLAPALRRLLPWPAASALDTLAPERLAVPSGSSAHIDYSAAVTPGGRPVVAVKLQELFGLSDTPRVADGRTRILFHLLSPARKPLAVTDDLASFWNGPYQDVRREMRGRYPKHPWPEDPWTAEATARTKRAQRGTN
ncbi:ATP-dependent helicase HrpB [Leucobacter komagatae]|uniref:Helicase n=1 Tax=Leucobacter komagatae TaxID=55969 RepID=A0A0D0IVR2_9MICO|nr:ATP-dependent helicase HrpB [Leucobacter komagatae]KIP53678.1 helicase [Leucobacter komagatae]